jgi:exodeoxyribonuclease VII large subunit
MFEPPFWTVSEVTAYLRDVIESDYNLQDLWVQGEVSNLSRPSSGHLYFTLKDDKSAIKCVMWRNTVSRQTFIPRDGDAIEIHGSINIYEVAGQYQLYGDLIRPAGEGALYQEFLRLKARLENEGLFDLERKRSIPHWPQRIGIVTSPTGAALRDMLNTLRRRYPLAEVFLAPTPVQGDQAPLGIVAALQALNRLVDPDIILLARGGGSIEDLWAFNDERVARAIVDSYSPVISGVGHETDFTIADFVSDLRAPTPTAAAELATPDFTELRPVFKELSNHLARVMQSIVQTQRFKLSQQSNQLNQYSPQTKIRTERQRVDEYARRSETALGHQFRIQKMRLNGLCQRLNSLNPMAVLQRGYAVVTTQDGDLVRSIHQVKPGDGVQVSLHDGQFDAQVQKLPKEAS